MPVSKLAAVSAALLLALGLPLAAGAKEESKIQVLLVDDSNPGNGNGKGRSDGKMQSTFTERQATFQVHAKQLEPGVDYRVLARESEATPPEECELVEECEPLEGCELIQEFTAGSNGQVKLKIDLLQTGDETHPPIDPRGKLISICQGTEVVMSSWFYGDVGNDTPHTKVKEQTELDPVYVTEPDPGDETLGSVSARYDMGPNGKASLNLQLQNVAPGTYEIHVDEDPVAIETLTTNPGGIAKLSLSTHPGKGKGKGKGSGKVKGHNKKGMLPSDLDPRRKLIEVKQGGVVVFSGPMLAQIPNLNDCDLGEETTRLNLELGQPDVEVDVTTGVDESCGPIFGFAVSGATVSDLPAVDYTMLVDETDVGTPLTVTEDSITGKTSGELRFATYPASGEFLLDFPVGSGSLVQLMQGTTLFLEATLP